MFASLYLASILLLIAPKLIQGQCTIQCCNSLHQANDPVVVSFFGVLGIPSGTVPDDSIVGFGCGGECGVQTCCTGSLFNGLISTGCTPA
ncbi:hydrophobin-251 [Mycena floridula]|nr:hydrophobin-251 [Mycena floridula]